MEIVSLIGISAITLMTIYYLTKLRQRTLQERERYVRFLQTKAVRQYMDNQEGKIKWNS
jgi:cell shape-determining protein MreD